MGELAELGVQLTLLDANGALDSANLASALVAVVHIEEVSQVGVTGRSIDRILGGDTITSFSAGMLSMGRSNFKIPRGVYAIRLEGVTGLPATAKSIVVQAKMI